MKIINTLWPVFLTTVLCTFALVTYVGTSDRHSPSVLASDHVGLRSKNLTFEQCLLLMVIEPHFTVSDQSLKHEIKLNLEATNRSDCFVVRELEARSLGVVGPSFSVHSLRNSACNIDNFCIFLNAESPLAPHWNAATDRLLIKNQEGGLDLILFQNANAAFKTTLISRADFVDHFRKDGSSGNF